MTHISTQELIGQLQFLEPKDNRPVFVAVSGYGGSGKSTLANAIRSKIEDAGIIPIDDFIVGARNERSSDWSTFDRARLKKEVLEKAIVGEQLRYQQYNSGEWVSGSGGTWRELEVGRIVIIEGCSVIHPSLTYDYTYSAWIDCPQEKALESAKQRDLGETELFGGDDTTMLWDEVWGPNDKDFFHAFRPDLLATVLVEPQF